MKEFKESSVKQLLELFSESLQSLVPHLDSAGITWRDGSSYDAWDEITTVLFKTLVLDAIRDAVDDPQAEFPPYDLLLRSYAAKSLVIRFGEPHGAKEIFHSLGTSDGAFDEARFVQVTSDLLLASKRLTVYPLSSVNLAVEHRSNGSVVLLEKLLVPQ